MKFWALRTLVSAVLLLLADLALYASMGRAGDTAMWLFFWMPPFDILAFFALLPAAIPTRTLHSSLASVAVAVLVGIAGAIAVVMLFHGHIMSPIEYRAFEELAAQLKDLALPAALAVCFGVAWRWAHSRQRSR